MRPRPGVAATMPIVAVAAATVAAALAGSSPATAQLPWSTPARDPARGAYEAALAPGLADSSTARLERFLLRHPRHALAHAARHELGLADYARGQYARARERFREASRGRDALADESRYWEGLCLLALGRAEEARRTVSPLWRARRPGPRRWDAGYLVAVSWRQEGKRETALAAYEELLAIAPVGPGEPSALLEAARLAESLDRAEGGRPWRVKLARRYPRSPEAVASRGDRDPAARQVP